MVWFALSFQDQVEKYGAYVGIAAFFGLALLSVLYFSQARELKRLREWAGRAPERARELEQRVVAQATATVARRAPAMPAAPGKPTATIAPARRLAEMPAPEEAAAPQATELVDKVEDDQPATNGAVAAVPVQPGGDAATTSADGEAAGPPPAEVGAAPPEQPAAAEPDESPAAAEPDEPP